jgi:hypothetical protein
VKRDGETDEQAFERVKSSKHILVFHHDEFWPFYDVRQKFGRVILTINTAHPFFTELYEPLRKMDITGDDEEGGAPPTEGQSAHEAHRQGPIVALELLLLSLARTQGRLANSGEDARKLLEELRREWSDTYRIQMTF